ncbi:hypothetical protein R1sor_006821 [Riccia sorocarpa]|uniref:Uncharacterized protein n=1 Tax=Riccia sorocarpa TaxID=122646 RepID=A0ABD3HSV5_9MARC
MASQQEDGAHASMKRKRQADEETHPVVPPSPEDRCVRGKRKLSDGCSASLPITVSTDSESSADEDDGAGNSPGNYTEATFTELVNEADAIAEEVVFFDVTVRQYGVEVEESDIVEFDELTKFGFRLVPDIEPVFATRSTNLYDQICPGYGVIS